MPGRRRILASDRGNEPARQIGRREHPKDADENHCQADDQRIPHELPDGNGIARQRAQHFGQLQSDEDEDETGQKKFHHFPDRPAPEPGLESEDFGHAPAEIQTGGHDRQHAGNAQSFGRQISGKGCQQRNRDLDRRIIHAFVKLFRQPADRQAEQNPADAHDEELPAGLGQ